MFSQLLRIVEDQDIFKPQSPEDIAKRDAERRRMHYASLMAKGKQIENRQSYRGFAHILEAIKAGDIPGAFDRIHTMMDGQRAFGSAANSDYAQESIDYLMYKEGVIKIDEAEDIFKPAGEEDIASREEHRAKIKAEEAEKIKAHAPKCTHCNEPFDDEDKLQRVDSEEVFVTYGMVPQWDGNNVVYEGGDSEVDRDYGDVLSSTYNCASCGFSVDPKLIKRG